MPPRARGAQGRRVCRGDAHAGCSVGVRPHFLLRGYICLGHRFTGKSRCYRFQKAKVSRGYCKCCDGSPTMRAVPKSWGQGWRHRPDARAALEKHRKGPD